MMYLRKCFSALTIYPPNKTGKSVSSGVRMKCKSVPCLAPLTRKVSQTGALGSNAPINVKLLGRDLACERRRIFPSPREVILGQMSANLPPKNA